MKLVGFLLLMTLSLSLEVQELQAAVIPVNVLGAVPGTAEQNPGDQVAPPAAEDVLEQHGQHIQELHQQLAPQQDTLGQDQLEVELGYRQGLVEDLNNKYRMGSASTEMENEFFLIKKIVDDAYKNNMDLETHLEGLTDEINFLRQVFELKMDKLQSQIPDNSVDNSRTLCMDSIVAQVPTENRKITNHSQAEAEDMFQIKYEELLMLVGKHGDEICTTKTKISKKNWNSSQLQAKIEGFNGQRASLEAAIAHTESHGKLAIKDANTKLAELGTARQRAMQNTARRLHDFQDLLNVKLSLDIEIATYRELLEDEEI
ncbi:Keratin, type II cytoskeletal 8 [Tupaia chinensis]|uniref:Keratin, type II cytoskeletal 8 n=1 Tax=Tupaia chinensis TaxID=246437 RepID=L9KFP7_TUPCH|nr:Keratin, type II cytoskeletal 8 [Tupaia chinensis]